MTVALQVTRSPVGEHTASVTNQQAMTNSICNGFTYNVTCIKKENTMHIDDANLINALRSIINEEISKRLESTQDGEFDIHEHRYEIDDMIREYIESNVSVTLDVQ
jgi:hypothetical protein